MDFMDKRVENACPSGIDRCECVHAPGRKEISLKIPLTQLKFTILTTGTFTKGPISFKDDLLGSLITFMGCNPGKRSLLLIWIPNRLYSIFLGFCFCNNAPNVEVDVREHSLRAVMDLCPRGEMDRCLCKDNNKIIWPFTAFDLVTCSPRKVKSHRNIGNLKYKW